jgi:aryl carrier-like protein
LGVRATPVAEVPADAFRMLRLGTPQVASVAVEWPRFARLYTSRAPTRLFEALGGHASPTAIDALKTTAVPEAVSSPRAFRHWLVTHVSATLGLAPGRLDPAAPLPRLGLDSLMALDLRSRLLQHGIDLSLADLLGGLSLNDVVGRVEALLVTGASPAPAGAQGTWITGEI